MLSLSLLHAIPEPGEFIQWGYLGALIFLVIAITILFLVFISRSNDKIDKVIATRDTTINTLMEQQKIMHLNCENRIASMADKCMNVIEKQIIASNSLENTVKVALEFLSRKS